MEDVGLRCANPTYKLITFRAFILLAIIKETLNKYQTL